MGQTFTPLPTETVGLVGEYEEYLVGLGLAPGSVYNYVRKLVRAEGLAVSSGWDLTALTPRQAAALAEHFPHSTSSRGVLRAALVHYWNMCAVEGPSSAIRIPKPPPWRYRGLEDDEAEVLESTAHGWWPQGTAVLLGLYLALRRAEMASLR